MRGLGLGPGLLIEVVAPEVTAPALSPSLPLTSHYAFPDPKAELFPLPSVWPCIPHAKETNTTYEDSQH